MAYQLDVCRRLALAGSLALLVLASVQCTLINPKIRVTVTNSQEELMRDVTVTVTGAHYELGDIVAEASKSVVVEPTGESDALIKYREANGRVVEIEAGAYMEPGYNGTIALTVYPGGDSKLVVRVRP
ncbi:MAG: hypothetical protein WBQ66_21090 [Blastocatellia bacterium]